MRKRSLVAVVGLTWIGLGSLTPGCQCSKAPIWKTTTVALDIEKVAFDFGEGTKEVQGFGTGVFLDRTGLMATADHVIRRTRLVQARFEDGSKATPGLLVSHDQDADLALLKVDPPPEDICSVELARREQVEKGMEVIAVGNEKGYGLSVLRGHVSNIVNKNGYEFLTLDAPLNPGCSGGPVFDLKGRLVGIMSGIEQGFQPGPSGEALAVGSPIGFAVPAWRLADLVAGRVGEKVNLPLECAYSDVSVPPKPGCPPRAAPRVREVFAETHPICLDPGDSIVIPLPPMSFDKDFLITVGSLEGTNLAFLGEKPVRLPAGHSIADLFTTGPWIPRSIRFENPGDDTSCFKFILTGVYL